MVLYEPCDIFNRYVWEAQTAVLIPNDNETGTESWSCDAGGTWLLHQGECHSHQIWKSFSSQVDIWNCKLTRIIDSEQAEHKDLMPLIPKVDILHDPESVSSMSHPTPNFHHAHLNVILPSPLWEVFLSNFCMCFLSPPSKLHAQLLLPAYISLLQEYQVTCINHEDPIL